MGHPGSHATPQIILVAVNCDWPLVCRWRCRMENELKIAALYTMWEYKVAKGRIVK
jgi:hypothetical protein